MGANDDREMLDAAKAECVRLERALADSVPFNALQAVLEAYTSDGVMIWLTTWAVSGPEDRHRMEAHVIQEWSTHTATPDETATRIHLERYKLAELTLSIGRGTPPTEEEVTFTLELLDAATKGDTPS